MYEIYCGEAPNFKLLYEDTSVAPVLALIDPTLILEEDKAGSFTCTIPVTHPLASSIEKRVTEIRIYRNGKLLWYGEVSDIDMDFYKQKRIMAEGPRAFLNNTMQNNHEYSITTDNDISNCMRAIIDHHNYVVDNTINSSGAVVHNQTRKSSRRKLYFGACDVGLESCIRQIVPNLQPTKLETSVDTSSQSALEDLVSTYGGYFEVRYHDPNGNPYTDEYGEPIGYLFYLPDYIDINGDEINERPISSQVIVFGKNLIDLTQSWSTSDICTVIRPLGANDEDGNPITIPNGYVAVSTELLNKYGWIEKTVKWPDIDDPVVLENLANRYAKNLKFTNGVEDLGDYSLTITALDASMYNIDIHAINLGEKVRVYSEYHDMDQLYPVQRIELRFGHPEATTISLNRSKTNRDLTTSLSNIEEKVDEGPSASDFEKLSKEWDNYKKYNPDFDPDIDDYLGNLGDAFWTVAPYDTGNIAKVTFAPPDSMWLCGSIFRSERVAVPDYMWLTGETSLLTT